jgi:hypothetical protein
MKLDRREKRQIKENRNKSKQGGKWNEIIRNGKK